MKKKKNFAIIVVVLLLALSVVPAYATELDAMEQTPTGEIVTVPGEAIEEKTITQTASEWLSDHYDDIVGSVAAGGLAILAFLITKVLIPAVNNAIKAAAERSKEAAASFNDKTSQTVELLEISGKYLDSVAKDVEKMISDLEEKFAAQAKAYELQTDNINYLLMNLRIPNELKAEFSQRTEAVKAALKEVSKG